MISNRCYYALRAVLELAKNEGGGLLTISHIARAQKIPARFLEAILVQLKQQGIAHSVRGKEGGYQLARPAATITVGDIVGRFERGLTSVRPAAPSKGKRRSSPDAFDETWRQAEKALTSVLSAVTFAKLAEKEKRREAGFTGDFVI